MRCAWAEGDALLARYHDEEWGRPVHDDRRFFEMLVLESFQAGLSWLTILRKREAFRAAFADFDPVRVAAFGPDDRARLSQDARIVRNRAKIAAAIANAAAFLAVREAFGTFDAYVWRFVGGEPMVRRPRSPAEVPSTSPEAALLSRDLRERGFRFVGPTVAYAFMQATGLVDDHTAGCFRCSAAGPAARGPLAGPAPL